jgi:hypothetical protein
VLTLGWLQNLDYQTDASGAMQPNPFNYTLCIDVTRKSNSMTCSKGVACPGGADVAHSVYTGGITYTVDFEGKCTKKPCTPASACAPPDAIPFSFILLDDDARGIAEKVGTATIDGVLTDHYTHQRGPGALMNWYLRNVTGGPGGPMQLVRNNYSHSTPSPGNGVRDFYRNWVTPAPASALAIPKGCSNAVELEAGEGFDFPAWAHEHFGDWY